MTSLFSSDLAIAALAALRQRGGPLALAAIAHAVDSPLSAAQKALRLLRDSGVVVADAKARPRYTVSGASVAAVEHLVLAALGLGQHRVLDAALRASAAVEFAARDPDGLLIVTRFDAEIEDEARLEQLLAIAGVRARVLHHDDVRDEVEADDGLRARARAASVIVGSIDRSFPDPARRGSLSSPFLGRLHPDLKRPAAAAIARVARDFGLEELRVFGSAVHDDFRPDSDVDVLVRRRRGSRRTIGTDMRLRRALEDIFDRDVDVVDAAAVLPNVAARAEREGVTLYG
jgi:hypothetical protein